MKTAYSVFNSTGKLKEVKPLVNGLPVGCIIFSYGYGMEGTRGAVISAPDSNGAQKCVYTSQSKNGFFSISSYVQPHSQKFGIGKYYDDAMECIASDILADFIEKAVVAQHKEDNKKNAKETADRLEQQSLPLLFPHLVPNPAQDHAVTKKNVLSELKNRFPGVKFSGRKEYYGSYSFSWTDGPCAEEADLVIKQFEDHKSDASGDFRDSCPSNFNRVFGGFKYASSSRETIADKKALALELEKIAVGFCQGQGSDYASNLLYRILRKTSIPAGMSVTGIVQNNREAGMAEDFFSLVIE